MSLPIVVVTGRRRYHEVFLLAGSVLTGLGLLIGGPAPNSINRELEGWMVPVWAAALLFSGLIGLAGVYWPWQLDTGQELERWALVIQAGAMLLYVGAVLGYAPLAQAWFVALLVTGWSAAHIARAIQITRDMQRELRAFNGSGS